MADSNDFLNWFTKTPGNTAPTEDINKENYSQWMNYLFGENGGPGYDSALVNGLRGIRILGPGNAMAPIPDDTIGLAFVSRPSLNLSDANVQLHDQLTTLVSPRPNTPASYIKGMLDPKWGAANSGMNQIFDPLIAWIPPLTNYLKVSSGFPDMNLGTGKSSPGFRGEVYAYVEGILKVNYDYEVRQSYYAVKPGIIPALFNVWVHYIEAVTLGDEGMQPYFSPLRGNYLDYTCRIYHLIMNKNMRNIEWIFCSGGGWPTTFPSGAYSTIDRTQNTLRGQGQDEFEVNFTCQGFRFNNISIAAAFNDTTIYRNPNLHPRVREKYYRKCSFKEYYAGGYGVYPMINLSLMEMEYWKAI